MPAELADAQAQADADLTPSETPAEDTSSPAPAEATSLPAEGAPADAAETPPASEAPARDEQGRFTKPAAAEAEPGTQETPEAEPDLSEYPVFTYRAEGRDVEFLGAVRDEEGNILFTPEAAQHLRQDLAYARAYQRRDAEYNRDIGRERTSREAAETALNHTLATFDQMVEQSQGATTMEELVQTPIGQWLIGLARNWPSLRAEAMQKGFEIRSKAQDDELNRYRQQEEEAAQRPVMLQAVQDAVAHYGTQAGFTEKEQAELIKEYTTDEMLDLIFPRATQDDPATGVKKGQRVDARADVLRREMLRVYKLIQGRTPAQTATAVQAENDKRLGKTGPKPPPTAGVSHGKPAGTKPTSYKSTREADDDIWR